MIVIFIPFLQANVLILDVSRQSRITNIDLVKRCFAFKGSPLNAISEFAKLWCCMQINSGWNTIHSWGSFRNRCSLVKGFPTEQTLLKSERRKSCYTKRDCLKWHALGRLIRDLKINRGWNFPNKKKNPCESGAKHVHLKLYVYIYKHIYKTVSAIIAYKNAHKRGNIVLFSLILILFLFSPDFFPCYVHLLPTIGTRSKKTTQQQKNNFFGRAFPLAGNNPSSPCVVNIRWCVGTWQVIFTYLYGGSILFFLYVFCYLLHDSSQKKRQRNKEKKDKETKKDEEVASDAAASKSGERKQSFLQVSFFPFSLLGYYTKESIFFLSFFFCKSFSSSLFPFSLMMLSSSSLPSRAVAMDVMSLSSSEQVPNISVWYGARHNRYFLERCIHTNKCCK